MSINRTFNPTVKLQRLKRQYRQQQGTYRETYLAAVNGKVRGTQPGYLWVHDAASADSGGNITYGAPYQLRIYPGAVIDLRPNWKVNVITENNIEYIRSMNFEEMIRADYNPHQTNMLDPSNQMLLLDRIIDLQSLPRGDETVQIAPGLYEKANATYGVYSGSSPNHIDILTDYTPSSGNSLFACVWLDTYTNTVSVSASSEFTTPATNPEPSTYLPYINEAALGRPADAIGLRSYIVASSKVIMDATTMFRDLRPFLHSLDNIGWQYILDRKRRIWLNFQQVVYGQQTIEATGQLEIIDGGQLVVLAA
jgi:hypothetical protein